MTESASRRFGYVAIVGRPNVGKSTLLNRLVGQKLAITSHRPQTTRHTILGVKTLGGGQIAYVDTPGIHQRRANALNRYLNRTARGVLRDVDVIVFLVEALRWTAEDQEVLAALEVAHAPVILAVNKTDRLRDKAPLLPFLADLSAKGSFRQLIPVSARKGENLDALESAVLSLLPAGEPLFAEDQVTDRPERFFAGELLREQLIRLYGEELPYSVSVEVEQFVEQAGLYRIGAVIWVERSGQKAILIGKQGAALKQAASRARLEMERFFGCKVFLEVWVKVKKSWSSDEAALGGLGYGG